MFCFRWLIYFIFFPHSIFFISVCFVLFSLTLICFRWLRLFRFVFVDFVSFRFISFSFYFVSHFIGTRFNTSRRYFLFGVTNNSL
jgi:hypothetical protein